MKSSSLWMLARYENGFPFKPEDFGLSGTPVVRIRQLINPDAEIDLTERQVPTRYQLRNGDLIFSWSGSLAVQTWSRGHAWLNQHLFKVVPAAAIYQGWLRWTIEASIPQFLGMMHGSAMTHLTHDMLKQLRVDVPPLDEQRRIADFLDAETARIDRLQAARIRQLATLEELTASRISSVVPTRGEAPFVRLGYLAFIQSGVTVDSNRDSGDNAVTLPYLRVANVQDGHVDLESVTEITVPRTVAQASRLRRGDVLMTEGGDLDKLGRGTVWNDEIPSCLHQNHVFAVRPDQRKIIPEYLALMTRTAYARAYFESTGTKTTNLASTSSSKIRDFRVPLIDLTDQARIWCETDAWLKDLDKAQTALAQQRDLLAERRQALITAAVTGEIDVTTARGVAT